MDELRSLAQAWKDDTARLAALQAGAQARDAEAQGMPYYMAHV